jgi:hypothetical protein
MLGSTEGHSNILAAVQRTPPQVRDVLAQFPNVINQSGDLSSIKHMLKHMLETAGYPVTAQFRGLYPAELLRRLRQSFCNLKDKLHTLFLQQLGKSAAYGYKG